jgi:hypothetical protein
MPRFIQWTSDDNKTFFPAGKVVPQLPPGYYNICESMHGLYLDRKDIKNEDLLRFPDTNSDSVIAEMKKFWTLEESFAKSGIPYKRGIMLYGPPGSGKTCTLRLVVEDLIKNQSGIVIEWTRPGTLLEGYNIIRQVHSKMPIIVLMEDVDAILSGYGESSTLNLLDGVHDINRVVFLATTNHPEQLGSRIVNRPSRFDKRFLIGMPNAEARSMFLEHKGIKGEELKRWVEDTNGLSIAHLKELYVATKILGDPYDQAIETIGEMKFVPSSKYFDDTQPASPEKVRQWSESKYSEYGTGKCYTEGKKSRGGLITEGRTTPRQAKTRPWSVDDIASRM